jgi:hypothetical protein
VKTLLDECRRRLGPPERPWTLAQRYRMKPPRWLAECPQDALRRVYPAQQTLFRGGLVVWGAMVQGAEVLFSAGDIDAPADVLYSFDPYYDDHPEALLLLSAEVLALKDATDPDPSCTRLVQALGERHASALRVPVPAEMAGERTVYFGTVIVCRKHLPQEIVAGGLFPLLAHPQDEAALLLPAAFWAEDLRFAWME